MKQKCILSKKKNTLVVKEVAQTEPGSFSLVFEMELENTAIEEAIKKGNEAIIELFRSQHFYPVSFFAERLAENIATMFGSEPVDSLHVEFNDIESLQTTINKKIEDDSIDKEKELAEIDTLLDDDEAFEVDANPDAADNSTSTTGAKSASDEPEA